MTEKFVFREKRKTVAVCYGDIVFFESYGHYITVCMKDGSSHATRCTMATLEKLLDKKFFARIHRGIIVNLCYVEKINYRGAWLKTPHGRLPVSRSCREIAEELFYSFKKDL